MTPFCFRVNKWCRVTLRFRVNFLPLADRECTIWMPLWLVHHNFLNISHVSRYLLSNFEKVLMKYSADYWVLFDLLVAGKFHRCNCMKSCLLLCRTLACLVASQTLTVSQFIALKHSQACLSLLTVSINLFLYDFQWII